MASRNRGPREELDEPTLRRLLAGHLLPPGGGTKGRALTVSEVEALEGAMGFRRTRGGVFTSEPDALASLRMWCFADPRRFDDLLTAPEGDLRRRLRRALRRAARDTGGQRKNPGVRLQKALSAVLLKALRATPPVLAKAANGQFRSMHSAKHAVPSWPRSVDDAESGEFVHKWLAEAAFAALAEEPGGALSASALRSRIAAHYPLLPREEPWTPDADNAHAAQGTVGRRLGFTHEARVYAGRVYDQLTPRLREIAVVYADARDESDTGSYAATARALACDEATVRRAIAAIMTMIHDAIGTTSLESAREYFEALLAEVRVRL